MNADLLSGLAIPVTVACIVGLGRWMVRALGREMRRVVVETVDPKLDSIHRRIDDHMDEEEQSLLALSEVLAELAGLDLDQVRGRLERKLD